VGAWVGTRKIMLSKKAHYNINSNLEQYEKLMSMELWIILPKNGNYFNFYVINQ